MRLCTLQYGGRHLVNIPNIFGPFHDFDTTPVAVSALTAYFLFAAVAFWLDKNRVASEQ